MNFFQLPVVSSTNVTDASLGTPFTNTARNLAWYGEYNFFVGTDNGTVYIARVKNDLYFVCIGSGYYGYTWITESLVTAKWEVQSTDYSSIYMVKGPSIPSMYTWNIDLTNFANTSDMLSMFYDTYVDTSAPNGIVVRVIAANPDSNAQGGESDVTTEWPDEEEGYFDDTSDEVPPSSIPTVSGTTSGLVTLFRATQEQLNQLGAYLWTNLSDFIENLNKLFVNPMDYLISLNIFPVTPNTGTAREIKIGSFSTSISMLPITSQWYEFDCGTITIHEYWGSYLDYTPYTKVHAMLPFIGSVTLNTDEVMNQVVGLKYRIDLLSGQCVALITINNSVYYQFAGECAIAVPLTASDWSRVYSAATAAIGTAITGGVGVASVGATTGISGSAALGLASTTEAVGNLIGQSASIPKGTRGITNMRNQLQEAVDINMNAARQIAQQSGVRSSALRASRLANTGAGLVSQVMSAKGHIQHSGTISGSASVLGERSAYVMLEYPNQSLPDNYKHFVGYPSNVYAKLSTLSGYTECEQVIVEGLSRATDSEISELTEALKGGVYL